jgi:hypothetical protein
MRSFNERISNRCAIGNGPLFVNAQSEWKNFARDEDQVSVLNVAEQELRPSVENRRAHERSTSKR